VSWTYNDADRPLTETISGGTLGGWSVTNGYNVMLQRTTQSLRENTTERQKALFGYDNAGRMSAVTNGLSTGLRAAYGYLPNSSLIGALTLTNNNTGRGMTTTREYDRLNRLRSISSKAVGSTNAPVLPVAFEYQYNAANQRTRVNREDGAYWIYTYDELGQVVSGRKYWADGTEVAGQQFDYTFDTIGNRKNTGGRASAVSTYSVNRLNQYSQRSVPGQVDVLGIANPTADVTVRVLGGTAYTAARKGEYYHHALAVGNNVYPQVEVKSLYGATQAQTNRVFNPPSTETFVHDADGNLTNDGRWTYTWDGENRLIGMIRDTGTPAGARQWLRFEYDHQGRRVRKRFDTHNGSGWVLSSDTAFAYDGWNLVAELNAASSNARLRTYLWGLDLSTSEQGAGGVGGLLLVTDYEGGTTHHWPAFDGNGNVAALVAQADGSLSARYEYGPFGEAIRATGAMGKKNPIRFSTKYTDDQTGLLYYGYRYYNPTTGRWINRDPIGHDGSGNLYEFCGGDPILRFDFDGREYIPLKCPSCRAPISPFYPLHCGRCGWPDTPPSSAEGAFEFCRRPIDQPQGWEQECANRICGIHSYTRYTDRAGKQRGWGFGPSGEPHEETEALLKAEGTVCAGCRTRGSLKYGTGAGKFARDATAEEIWSCLTSRPAKREYDTLTYNCWNYSLGAQNDCGLVCQMP
jgi:RHS repeat-associated protein